MRALWLAMAAILVVACASTPVASSKAFPVPAHRVYATELTRPQGADAFLVVTRDEGLIASKCAASLYVDGTHVADLRNSEQIRLFVKVGTHLVGVRANKDCFGGSDQTSIDVTQDQPTLLRIEVALGDGWKIRPSAF